MLLMPSISFAFHSKSTKNLESATIQTNVYLLAMKTIFTFELLNFLLNWSKKWETELRGKIIQYFDFIWLTWSAKMCRCDCASSSSLWACCLAKSWVWSENNYSQDIWMVPQLKLYLHAMHEANFFKDIPTIKHPLILKKTLGKCLALAVIYK